MNNRNWKLRITDYEVWTVNVLSRFLTIIALIAVFLICLRCSTPALSWPLWPSLLVALSLIRHLETPAEVASHVFPILQILIIYQCLRSTAMIHFYTRGKKDCLSFFAFQRNTVFQCFVFCCPGTVNTNRFSASEQTHLKWKKV